MTLIGAEKHIYIDRSPIM